MEALRQFAQPVPTYGRKNMTDASQSPETTKKPSGTATTAEKKAAMESFLIARGIDPEIAHKLGLRGSENRINFAYVKNGKLVYWKWRGIQEKSFGCQPGQTPFFWNFDVIHDKTINQPLLITEGELDCVVAVQCGHIRSISVPNGSQGEGAKLSYIDEVESVLSKEREIICAFDDDEKGNDLLQAFSKRFNRVRIRWIKYPHGCKDLNDVLKNHGPETVREIIQKSPVCHFSGVYTMNHLTPTPYQKPFEIGIQGFEDHMKIRLGDFSIWTGIPSSGKSSFLNDVVCRLNKDHQLKTAFASFEQHPTQDHQRALRTWHGEKLVKDMTREEIAKADEWINQAFRFIYPSENDCVTLSWILERAASCVIREDSKIIVIDPWNEIEHDRPRDMTLTEYVSSAIRELKRFAKKYQVHVAVVAHPAKMQRGLNGEIPVPTLYDISDSAHFYNKADLGVVVHRNKDGKSFVQIAKSRYHTEIGKPGIVDVSYDLTTARFQQVDNDVLRSKKKW
jgi:twinkle protein